jgi:(S)-2-hydroxy-acid oxidase
MNQLPEKYDKRLYAIPDYEKVAGTRFFRHAYDYFNSGANDESSLNAQFDAFREIKLKKRVCVDPKKWKDMNTTILGKKIVSPICVTSTAFQRMATPDGECATARACNAVHQTPMVLSSWATSSNEDIGQFAPDSVKVYQIYMSKIPEVN